MKEQLGVYLEEITSYQHQNHALKDELTELEPLPQFCQELQIALAHQEKHLQD